MGLFIGFLSSSINLYVYFVPVSHCFEDYSFALLSVVKESDSSSSVFLSQDLAIQGLMCFHANCKNFCSNSVKNALGSLIMIT